MRAGYPDYHRLCAELPGRTRKAIELKCERLGIVRGLFAWTAAEVSRLKRPYTMGASTHELRRLFPDKQLKQIHARAGKSR